MKVPQLRRDSHTIFKVKRSNTKVKGYDLQTGGGIPCQLNPAAALLVTINIVLLKYDKELHYTLRLQSQCHYYLISLSPLEIWARMHDAVVSASLRLKLTYDGLVH